MYEGVGGYAYCKYACVHVVCCICVGGREDNLEINLYLFCFINPLLVLIVSGHIVSLTAENMKYDEIFSIMIFNISKM